MQAPRKNTPNLSYYIVGAGLALPGFAERRPLRFAPQPIPNTPALAAPANPKIHPRTVGGPAVQAPTSKRQGSRKNTPALSII